MKHMKKSMFITTLIMTVVLVVALSTATFAWYTANTAVGATATTVLTAQSGTASLVVDEAIAANNMANNSSVDIVMTQNINPMIYDNTAAPTVGETTYAAFTGDFVTFTLDNAGKYTGVETATTPSLISTVKGSSNAPVSQDYFILTNTGGAAANFSATVTIYNSVAVQKSAGDPVTGLFTNPDLTGAPEEGTGENVGKLANAGTYYTATNANNFMRVAMFVDSKYAGTWALSSYNTVYYYDYANNHAAQGVTKPAYATSYTATVSGTAINNIKTNVASMDSATIQLVVWFEGDNITNANAGSGATFKVDFGATNYNP